MGDGIPALDLDASDACTDVFLQGQSLVRISREMGLQMELARDAYKKPDLKRVRVVRLLCVRSHEGGPGMIKRGFKIRVVKIDSAGQIHLEETGLALIPGVDQYVVIG